MKKWSISWEEWTAEYALWKKWEAERCHLERKLRDRRIKSGAKRDAIEAALRAHHERRPAMNKYEARVFEERARMSESERERRAAQENERADALRAVEIAMRGTPTLEDLMNGEEWREQAEILAGMS